MSDIKRDITAVASMLMAVQDVRDVDPEWSIVFRHDGQPKAKGRPRLYYDEKKQRGRVHTPEKTEIAETALAWRWKAALRGQTFDGSLAIGCIFYRSSYQIIDVDNMLKLVLDAGTQARAWFDDSQIVSIVGRTEYDKTDPRTEIALMPTVSTMDRTQAVTKVCEECGREYTLSSNLARANPTQRYCSRVCHRVVTARGTSMTPRAVSRRNGGGNGSGPKRAP